MNQNGSIIRMANIRKVYDTGKVKVEALKGIDLDVMPGEMVAIVGPSGSGKSTLLNLVGLLDRPTAGTIALDGRDTGSLDDAALTRCRGRTVGFIFQFHHLLPEFSALENVMLPMMAERGRPDASMAECARHLLAGVGLDDHLAKRPGQLSGGQQQRVAIARAVVNKPKVLLLDESLSALDYKLRKQMQNELKALQRKLGITFVFVTHDQEEALTMSDRIVVMREGRIEQDGTPREIYEEPKNLFVASFIGEINIFDAVVLQRLDPQRVRANVEGRECDIYADLPVEPGQKLKVLLRPEDLRVEEVNDSAQHDGLIGYVRERNYKGMTLESVVELENGKTVMVSEFFNEDDPDVDHSLNQKMAVTWVESWEVVLADEEIA